MIGVRRMDKTWTDEFYREMDADKRLVLLKENIESNPTAVSYTHLTLPTIA